MKINRNRLLGVVAIGLLTMSAGASKTVAQRIAERGSFTLPFEVRWNSAVLPAGDYTFTMDSTGLNGTMNLQGPNGTIFLRTMALSDQDTNQRSALSIENVPMRLAMKFGESFAITTPLPSLLSQKSLSVSTTSLEVFGPGMTSTNLRYRGGLKKCVPAQCC